MSHRHTNMACTWKRSWCCKCWWFEDKNGLVNSVLFILKIMIKTAPYGRWCDKCWIWLRGQWWSKASTAASLWEFSETGESDIKVKQGEVFSHFIDFQFNALVWIVIKFKETPHGHCHCHGHGELEEEEWLSEYCSSFLHKAGASLVGWGQGGDEMQLFGNHCENDNGNGFDLKSLWRFMVMEKTPFIQLLAKI